ncbi:MAG: flagellar hook protein FlgE [Chloroflexi bacterium]|nr:flagellar hook protein FlgE [Chloroflexota bacterium]
MLRSMFTAISSLNLHQYFMDVVADNLANANTYGFKSNRISFQDQFAQTLWMGSAPLGDLGGINPAQVGLGVRMGAISGNFSQGALQATGRNTDLAIQGDGFFIYADGTMNFYSRDGALDLDSDGYLVNSATGMRIQGWQAALVNGVPAVDTGSPIGPIQLPLGTTMARATQNASLGGNLDANLPTVDDPATPEVENQYTNTIGVYDSLGVLHSVTITYTHTGDNAWTWAASGPGVDVASSQGALTFDPSGNGQYLSGSGVVTITGSGGAADTVFDLDLSGLTQLATDGDISVVTQDGLAAGDFSGFYVTPETGEIYGVYSNGMQQLVGQLALASFVNPNGLVRAGQNMFQTGVNSGDPAVGAAGVGDRGSVIAGYLEGSNVDLAQEFTNMILAQRGFQASSRVITTSDEMLQELVNIKR